MSGLFDVSGKVAAITGGGGVLCGEIARQIGRSGAAVGVLDIDEEAAERVARDIVKGGGRAAAVRCDVLDKGSIEKAKVEIEKKLGAVEVLINGAGGNKKEATTSEEMSFFDIPEEAIRYVFELNVVGTILPCQVFGKVMVEKERGVVINISSMNAFRPLTRIAAYSAAKAAVSNFTQWLAVYMCQNYSKQIRVNAIAPGFFMTEQNKFLLKDTEGQLTERGRAIIEHTPMARFGEADELAGCVLWLMSEASKFVTGIVVPVDGGFSSFSGV